MSSTSKAEIAALFYNIKAAIPLCVTLQDMGHVQPPTPVKTDNSTAHGLITKIMTPKASKAMDMQFHYLKCREAQRHFRFLWRRAQTHCADYHTKQHPTRHYMDKQKEYVINMPKRQ